MTRTWTALLALALGWGVGSAGTARAEAIRIGVIAPMTGVAAPWGMALATGAKILAARYNAGGGITVGGKTYTIEIVPYDDQYKTPEALSAYQRLVDSQGIKYVVIASGASTMAIKRNIEDDGIVAMTAGYSPDAIDAATRYLYRMYGIPADFYPPLYDWLAKNTTARRVAILNPNDETARAMSELSAAQLKTRGYEVLSNELFEKTQKDFLPLLTKVLAGKPDLIDLGATPPALSAILIRQAREFGYKGLFVVPGSTSWKEIVDAAGVEGAEGVITVLYVDPNNEAYRGFAAEYVKLVGQEPNEALAPYSDGVNVLIQAIQKSGAVGDTARFEDGFRKALPMKSLQGAEMVVGGKERYGVDHQVSTVRYIGVIRNGKPVVSGTIH